MSQLDSLLLGIVSLVDENVSHPQVVQHHDIYSCNLPMGSVLGSCGAFQGNIWSVAPFIPVGPGENQ